MMKKILVAVAIVFVAALIRTGATEFYRESNIKITVKDKEMVVDRASRRSRYLVWSEDEVFENVNSLVKGKFNSSDLYGKMQKGKTYNCRVCGFRNGFFSMYRNLIECNEDESK